MAHEIGDQPPAIGGVHHFGVELGAVIFAFVVGDHRKRRAVRYRDNPETGREPGHLVAVAHPHLVAFTHLPQPVEQHAGLGHGQERATEFARIARFHRAAQLVAHHLLAITDAKDRQSAVKQHLRRTGAAVFGYAGRGSRQDDALGLHPVKRRLGRVERRDFGIDPGLAYAAGDQLGHLAAEIDDQDGFGRGFGHGQPIVAVALPVHRGNEARRGPRISINCVKCNWKRDEINCGVRQLAYWRPRSVAPCIYTLPAHERGDCLKVPRTMEDTMRSFTTVVLPIILAAGISGLMFTATLA